MRSRPSLLTIAMVAACTTPGLQALDLERIEPTSATRAAAVPVQLDGAFALDITSNLDDGTVEVASVDVLIDDTPLVDVVWQDDRRIDATMPAGLPPGRHDIIVRIGARRAVLPEGFAVIGSELTASLSVPSIIGRGNSVDVTMTVTNTGVSAATMVVPSDLTTSGTAGVMLTTPAAGGASLAAGGSTTFTWTYTAQTVGTVAFSGNATATDELTVLPIASPSATSNVADVVEVVTVASDPLGDGSPFGYVAGYQGHVYVGPNATGTSVARVLPDGTSLETGIGFTFTRDVTGNTTSNTSATYTSIGFTGCTPNSTCGPDNENGRGQLVAGTLGGTEWLVMGGARSAGDLDYIYMTSDIGTTLGFRYVDLSAYTGPATTGFSAAHFLGNRLYLGFPDTGGARPYLIALQTAPATPGLDAAGIDALDLQADTYAAFNAPNPAMIDAFGDLNGLLYVGNQSGIVAAKNTNPGPFSAMDWSLATPAATQWNGKTSRSTTKQSDLFPADRAIPQFATFAGRLFMGRNTTSGPQLWVCDPALNSSPTRCEPDDWQLAASNIIGDNQLSQFNNAALTSITMVVATSKYLYVGFDSSSGAQVYRTSKVDALLPVDFEGAGGCAANMQPSCPGIGGSGLGDPTDTRILDAKAITFGPTSSVWVTVGGATGATRLVAIP